MFLEKTIGLLYSTQKKANLHDFLSFLRKKLLSIKFTFGIDNKE